MANETRPRREPSGTSRIRKTSPPSSTGPTEDADGPAAGSTPPMSFGPGPADPPAPGGPEPSRDRKDREPYREEGPADREPIRYLRDRAREGRLVVL